MGNREVLHSEGEAKLYIYENAQNDYYLGVDVDSEHVDVHARIARSMTSSQLIELGLRIMEAAMPWEGPVCEVIATSAAKIREAIK